MPSEELEFQRIARKAREFREQEEQRIAAEKEEQARQIAEQKAAERERFARSRRQSLEKQQEQEDDEDSVLLPSSSFDSKSSQPRPGTVKLRAEWLRKLEQDAAARRLLEEEFNELLAARRKNNPNESEEESEAAVKAVLDSHHSRSLHYDSDTHHSRSRYYDSHHSRSLHSVLEEDESRFSGRPQIDKDTDNEFTKIEAKVTEAEEEEEEDTFYDAQGEELDDVPAESSAVESEPSSKNEIAQQRPKETQQQDDLQYGVEVDPRTQAMLAEDDFVAIGNNAEDDGMHDSTRDRNKKTIILENSIPVHRKRGVKGSSKNNIDDDYDSASEIVYKEATFELPAEVAKDGLILSPDTASLNMITTIPPSRLGGRVSGRLEGRSTLGNKSNTASGSASLEYKTSRHSRLTVGMIRGCEPYNPLITIGGRLLRHGSTIGVTFYHNAKFLHQMMLEHSLWSLSFQHCFPNSKWCLSSELSRRQDLSFSLKNGNKLSGAIGWNLLKTKQFHARFDAYPSITVYRRAHIYCHWQALSGTGVWNFGVSLIQNLHSQIATFGLGLRLFSTRGVEWVVSWSRGNATIRMPIVVSKELAANSTIGHSLYISVISYLIQDYIAEVWGWIGNGEEDDDDYAVNDGLLAIRAETLTKARRDAATQKELMTRQARRKAKDEKERDGLIITKAVYQIENEEEWDVTTQLQFWVSRSTLTLAAGPKSQLLGFYDIAASVKNRRAMSSAEDTSTGQARDSRRKFPSWRDMWYDLLDWTPKGRFLPKATVLPSPTLSVWYEFKGRSHQITIKDREELRLPAI